MSELVRVDDITVQQGDDRPLIWLLRDDAGATVDLTGYTALAQVRTSARSDTVLHEWSTTEGNAVLGSSSVTLTVDDSETWTWGSGVYDVHLINPDGGVEVIARGRITLIRGVTR